MSMKQSSRARGGNRGGVGGGGYERLDPDFDLVRIRRLRAEYDELAPAWRGTYLKGLSKADQWAVTHRL
jgi:hypothetical protein